MDKRSFCWGWPIFGLGALSMAATWAVGWYTLLCWCLVVACIGFGWIILVRLRNGLTQSLLVGAALLNAAAGVANGLVMTANGSRMPVEPIRDWSDAPAFFDSPRWRESGFCRLFRKTDETMTPVSDTAIHYDVPVPHVVRGRIPRLAEAPRFAFLDDQHGIRLCGEDAVYSKGDMMGFIGTVFLGLPGLLLLGFGWLWRKAFPRAPHV